MTEAAAVSVDSPDKDVTEWTTKIEEGASEAADWAESALRGQRYYHGHQWDDTDLIEELDRIQITNNVIRRDIDQMVARVLDSEPVIDAHGRGAEDFELGELWTDLIRWTEEWTGYEFDACWDVRRRVFMDTFQTGEGIEKTWWCPHEEGGLGMVVSEWISPLELLWDQEARSAQRRDARWMVHMRALPVTELEREFSHLKGTIKSDYPRFFQHSMEQARFQEYMTLLTGDYQSQPADNGKEEKAYRFEIWEKEPKMVPRYYLKHSGKPAFEEEQNEETGLKTMVPMSSKKYGGLTQEQQDLFVPKERKVQELRQGVMCGGQWGKKMQISEYDESKGGHGEYPFSFYSNIHDPSQSHAHGEVEHLTGHQDVINRGTSRWLEAMFIANSVFLAVQRGSMSKGEMGKLDNLGKRTLQKIQYYPGQQVPQFVGGEATNAQLFEAGIRFMQDQKDNSSGVHNVNRAAPQYDMSGKAIRALQSDADLFGVMPRKSIESGLRQATQIRVGVMQQFMRGARIVRVNPKAEKAGYTLFMGEEEGKIKSTFNLEDEQTTVNAPGNKQKEVPTGNVKTATGEVGKVLPISDRSIRKFDLRFQLDTGREARREEKQELTRSFMEYLAPLAPMSVGKWAANQMEVDNREVLFEQMEEEIGLNQMKQMIEQAQEETGMPLAQMVQLAKAFKARQDQGAAPGGGGGEAPVPPGGGGPEGAPAPGGPPATPEMAPA